MKRFYLILLTLVISTTLYYNIVLNTGVRYTSIAGASVYEWLSMRFKEGSFPDVTAKDIKSVQQKADLTLINSPSLQPRATWIGHASMLVQYQGINFLTDPHLTDRAAPVDFFVDKRLTPPALTFTQLPKIDFIVISHNHFDHLDHRTVDMYANSVTWYVPMGLKQWFLDRGIKTEKVVELEWWQSVNHNAEVELTFTPNVHWSKRSPWDTNVSHWGAWAVKIGQFNSWFSGDTGYDEIIFHDIGTRLGPFDMAFIPIGAYAPRYFMKRQHVDPQQAVRIHQEINSKFSIPMHWATFQLTQEPFLEPPQLLVKALQSAKIDVATFKPINIGETVVLNK
ncbi:MAG: MBL fold metallo-hydrolase [Oceanospirillaceae bacterium]